MGSWRGRLPHQALAALIGSLLTELSTDSVHRRDDRDNCRRPAGMASGNGRRRRGSDIGNLDGFEFGNCPAGAIDRIGIYPQRRPARTRRRRLFRVLRGIPGSACHAAPSA